MAECDDDFVMYLGDGDVCCDTPMDVAVVVCRQYMID